jgi:hypothetical protein
MASKKPKAVKRTNNTTRAARTAKPKRRAPKNAARAAKPKRGTLSARPVETETLEPPVLPTPIATFIF